VKIFMGSSTGNLLVDNPLSLDKVFAESELLVATHCEDELIIKNNFEKLKKETRILEASDHPVIRNDEACFQSSFRAIQHAKKDEPYEKAHADLPLVQHSLLLMLHYVKERKITIEKVVEKMSHAVAKCFQIKERGYIREGYYADLVLVDLNKSFTVNKENILY